MIFGKLFLERVNNNFVRHVSDRFSEMLQANIELVPGEIKTDTFGDFIRKLPYFTSMNVFETKPTQRYFVLEINPQVVFSFTDRMLGGQGSLSMKERQTFALSEQLVLKKTMEKFKGIYCEVFFECQLVRQESQSRVIHTFLATDPIFSVDYQCYLNEKLVGGVHSCFPQTETI